MAMRQENAPNPVLVLDEVGKVGDHHIDAVHVVVGEPHPHIHYDHVPAILIDGEILSYLIETAQGYDF